MTSNAPEATDQLYDVEDFTLASPWEKLVNRVESVLIEWKLEKGGFGLVEPWLWRQDRHDETCGVQVTDSAMGSGYAWIRVDGETRSYILEYHFQEASASTSPEVLATDPFYNAPQPEREPDTAHYPIPMHQMVRKQPAGDFCAIHQHEIRDWYGLLSYVVLRPHGDHFVDQTGSSYLLSILSLAASNIDSYIPLFAVLGEPWETLYTGRMSFRGITLRFASELHSYIPEKLRYLSGLEELLEDRVFSPGNPESKNPMEICVRFVYQKERQEWESELFDPLDYSEFNGISTEALEDAERNVRGPLDDVIGSGTIHGIHWGVANSGRDPVTLVELTTIWPFFPRGALCDTPDESDLNPEAAPFWVASCAFAHPQPERSSTLGLSLFGMLRACDGMRTLAGFAEMPEEDDPLAVAMTAATIDPNYSAARVAVKRVLDRLEKLTKEKDENQSNVPLNLNGLKSAPFSSILSELCLQIMSNGSHVPARYVAAVWSSFCSTVRSHWEQGILLPGIPPNESPDMRYCIIYQKLQMFNYCVSRREEQDSAHQANSQYAESEEFDENLPDEQFEDIEPVGFAHALDETTTLLDFPDRLLQIPITQEHPVMTEDQIEQQHLAMSKMGTDTEASERRAEIQGAPLLSDMQAFKAANPGSRLEDFVRWYSPNDWVNGKLSARMAEPENLWRRLWERANAIPAASQKPLFDARHQGQSVVDYLNSLRPSQVAPQLLLIALSASYGILCSTPGAKARTPYLEELLQETGKIIQRFSQLFERGGSRFFLAEQHEIRQMINNFKETEIACSRAASLLDKFPSHSNLVSNLIRGTLPHQLDPEERAAMCRFLSDQSNEASDDIVFPKSMRRLPSESLSLPHPDVKQYCLLTNSKDRNSRRVGHRLFASRTQHQFLLATAWGASDIFNLSDQQ